MNTAEQTKNVAVVATAETASECEVDSVNLNYIAPRRPSTVSAPWGHYPSLRTDLQSLLEQLGLLMDQSLLGKGTDKPRVLIVDDEPGVLGFIERVLGLESSYSLATATDGVEAGHRLATFRPDLIVLDLMLPGITGFEICRTVRANPATRHVKILVVTGFASDENIAQILQCGADDFLEKPFTVEDLREKVRRLLAGEP